MSDVRILETERLLLRQLTSGDFAALCRIMQDDEVMYAYEGAFSGEEVCTWLDRQKVRYETDGFGLWAVVLKETGEVIGQCGLTLQDYDERRVVEVGYLFAQAFWHRGYAIEAASACRDYAFETLQAEEVFSLIRDTNTASIRVAERNGMRACGSFMKHYRGKDMPHIAYRCCRASRADIPG